MSLFDSLKKQILDTVAASTQDPAAPAADGSAAPHHGVLVSVIEMVQKQGVGTLVRSFQSNGLGAVVSSWVSRGTNLPISPEQIQQVLGSAQIADMAKKFGLPADQVSSMLAKILPATVDHLTPNGHVEEPAEREAEPSSLLPGPADPPPGSTEG